MRRSDLPAVLDIEKRSFRQPWAADSFLEALGGRNGARCFVLEVSRAPRAPHALRGGGSAPRPASAPQARRLVGYLVLELQERNAHLLNLAVHPDDRRQGHASRILSEVDRLCLEALEAPEDEGAAGEAGEAGEAGLLGEISLEVEESNLPAQLLYKKMGYRATRVLRNHYPALEEDAYKMVRKLYATPLGTTS
jgi:ribosomal-protein-alanine N-acetyltransferase